MVWPLISPTLCCCHSKSIVGTHIYRDQIWWFVDSGSWACWVECFRSLLAASLPHSAIARQRNGWPSLTTMKESLLPCFPLPLQKETHVHACLWREPACTYSQSVITRHRLHCLHQPGQNKRLLHHLASLWHFLNFLAVTLSSFPITWPIC